MTAPQTRRQSTSDALDRVHHHTFRRHVRAGLRGEPIPMACGQVRGGGVKGWDLPCCPICNVLVGRCAVAKWQGDV